jgi:hypothetical protein
MLVMIRAYVEAGCETEVAFQARKAQIHAVDGLVIIIVDEWHCERQAAGMAHSHAHDGYVDQHGQLIVPAELS